MKILLFVKRFDFGGAENHVCDLANSLYELGNEVYLVSYKGRQLSRLNKGIHFINYYSLDILLPLNFFFLYRIVKKYQIEIIHAHQRLAIFTSCILKKFIDIPVVVTVHGRTRLDLKSKLAKRTPERIIFVSQRVLEVSACYEAIKDISVVIPNGVEAIECDKLQPSPSFTYVSRVDRNHSKVIFMIIQQILPKLIEDIEDITFNLIGEGNCSTKIKIQAKKINRQLNREVCKIWDYQQDVKEIFRKSRLVLGVGRVALEALACGVPVLSINKKRLGTLISTSNYSDYKINNFVAIDKPPPTATELYNILNNYFTDMNKWQEEAKTIQDYIKKDFDLLSLTQKIVGVYNEAIGLKKMESIDRRN
jgi:glycosyltransferase involved in cell wall biosynthesis